MLWGKSSKCVIVTKGWLSVSMGVILLSASMVSILVSRSINSLRSAFSASISLPSKSVVIFTCTQQTREDESETQTDWCTETNKYFRLTNSFLFFNLTLTNTSPWNLCPQNSSENKIIPKEFHRISHAKNNNHKVNQHRNGKKKLNAVNAKFYKLIFVNALDSDNPWT